MVMNKFNSQVCTSIEQSQRLLELGLNPETADCQHFAYTTDSKGKPIPKRNQKWVTRIGIDKYVQVCGFMSATFIPAWSLHRLLEMYVERYISCNVNLKELTFDWLIDEIGIHITENDFNKEYLKQ